VRAWGSKSTRTSYGLSPNLPGKPARRRTDVFFH
jgi:hypothetical protein